MIQQWIIYALLSAVFAALVAIFGKIGLKSIDSNVATALRAFIMFLFMFLVVLFQKKFSLLSKLKMNEYSFIILAGVAGALSWLFYFLALKEGSATKVVALDRLSVVFVMIFALLFLGEAFSLKVLVGIVLIVLGAILMIL